MRQFKKHRRYKTKPSFTRPRGACIGTRIRVSCSLKRGVGLIYDRLGPESPGAIFSFSYIKIRKLLAAETGRKSSSVIPRNEWPRGMAAQSPPSRRDAMRRDACGACTTTNLHHSVGPMDRKMPPKSYPVAGISSRIGVRFPGVLRQSPATFPSPRPREENTKITSNRDREATTGDSGTEMERPTLRMADLKFQNFPDNVPRGGLPK